jgi:Zn-dependent peptidase ImmA (M78 family)
MNEKIIEDKVNEVFKKVNYVDSSDSIDVISIAKKLGFSIGNAAINNGMDGFIIIDESKDNILGIKTTKLIGVNSSRTLAWKRFIIAHELGHYVLYYDSENDNGLFAHRENKKGKNKMENAADFFAANLLMPRKKFTDKYDELKKKDLSKDDLIFLLTNKFVVTKYMIERRIGELHLDK